MCVVHQPRYEIFRMFDDMTLLARGGQLAYFGSRKEALPYFVKLVRGCHRSEAPEA